MASTLGNVNLCVYKTAENAQCQLYIHLCTKIELKVKATFLSELYLSKVEWVMAYLYTHFAQSGCLTVQGLGSVRL